MIDLALFKNILDAEDGYIERTDVITYELIDLLRNYKSSKWEKLFKIYPNTGFKNAYQTDTICSVCKTAQRRSFSKGQLVEYIGKGNTFICETCKKTLLEIKQENDIKQEEQRKITLEKERIENTRKYIETLLNPTSVWRDKTPLSSMIREIESYWVDNVLIKEHILKMDYYEFLKTPYWVGIALKVKTMANFKCALCYSDKRISAHHKTYKNHGEEHLRYRSDLICLCEKCHKKFHNVATEE